MATTGAALLAPVVAWSVPAAAGGPPAAPAEVPVTAMDVGVGWANNSPQLIAHPRNPRLVVLANRVDGPSSGCRLHISGDGGALWAPLASLPRLPKGVSACYAPEIAFDRSGRLYLLFVGLEVPGNNPVGVFLSTSDDNGERFSVPRKVLGRSNYQARLGVDPARAGVVWLVWLAASSDAPLGGFPVGANPILAARSDDAGASFSTPVQINEDSRPRSVAPAVAVGPDHRLRVAYFDLGDDARDYQGLEGPTYEGTWSVVVSISGPGRGGFAKAVVVADGVVPPGRPPLIYTMAPPALALGEGGRAYVGWTDARSGDADVVVARSGDGGAHFSAPVRVNDDPVGDGRSQYLPALATGPGGRLDAVFFDRRRDPANAAHDVSYASSVDGGRSFAPSRRLTAEASDPNIGQRWLVPSAKGQAELGSRLGLVALPHRMVVAWPDTRNVFGNADEFGGPIAQDIFSTGLRLSAPGRSWSWWSAVAGLAGAVVVGAGVALARRRRAGAPEA